jgi:heme/copper-type cytochrome/quinol oxidase subunit 2
MPTQLIAYLIGLLLTALFIAVRDVFKMVQIVTTNPQTAVAIHWMNILAMSLLWPVFWIVEVVYRVQILRHLRSAGRVESAVMRARRLVQEKRESRGPANG